MSSPEGPLRSMVWTAFTHLLIACGITVGVGGGAHLGHQYAGLSQRLLLLYGGMAAGGAFALYLGRELGEPDPATNLGSVLDILGGLLGALLGVALLNWWGWLPL